jgi:hypothetical protein
MWYCHITNYMVTSLFETLIVVHLVKKLLVFNGLESSLSCSQQLVTCLLLPAIPSPKKYKEIDPFGIYKTFFKQVYNLEFEKKKTLRV